jgi:hypothetical protein
MKDRKGFRKIHIGTEQWDYRFGKTSVTVYSPAGVKSVINYDILTGEKWIELDRDCKPPIGPAQVSDYILNNLFGKERKA